MSDSELSEPASAQIPPDSTLEKQLRTEVSKRFKNGSAESMTVNHVRQAAEKALGLEKGFYAGHADKWKAESKLIIHDEMEKQTAAPSSSLAPSNDSPAKVPTRSKPTKPSKPSKPPKRASPTQGGRPTKRVKNSKEVSDAGSEDDLSSPPSDMDEEASRPVPKAKPKAKPKPKSKPAPKKLAVPSKLNNGIARNLQDDSESALSASVDVQSDAEETEEKAAKLAAKPEDSESDMSVLLDDEPKAKKKKRKSSEPAEKSGKKTKAAKPKAEVDADPDVEEIKRLQGWLVKCGIRKLWGKELKPYESSKAKIKHLKDMLSDAGMSGRYSTEKATQIKEARELAADIEAVKEGAERWGKGTDDSEDEGDGKPKRRLVRGAKNYAFLSSDGEETD